MKMDFKVKYSLKDPKFRKTLTRLHRDPRTTKFLVLLENLIGTSRAFVNKQNELSELQIRILNTLMELEGYIRKANKERKEILKKSQSKDSLGQLEVIESHREILKILCKALREVGDGIAWRLFEYNRGALQHITDVKPNVEVARGGINSELTVLMNECSNSDRTGLLTSLTHFVSIGDVVIRNKNGSFEYIEVKSGKNSRGSRITKQMKRLNDCVAVLDAGEDINKRLKFIRLNVEPHNYFSQLKEAIEQSYSSGIHTMQLDSSNILQCFFYDKLKDEPTTKAESDRMLNPILNQWKENGDELRGYGSLTRFYPSKNFAPITIFPISPKACAELLLGKLYVVMYLNISEILRKFKSAGWNILNDVFHSDFEGKTSFDPDDIYFIIIEKNGYELKIAASEFAKVAYEFLKPEVLVAMAEELYTIREQISVYNRLNITFAKEGTIWN